MTPTPRGMVDASAERGSALVGVLLLLMMMSALAAALGVSGHTETLVARNHQAAAQAQAAAEAGLNHAVQVVVDHLRPWQANGFDSVDEALDALLLGPDLNFGTADADADNGSLAALGIPLGSRLGIADAINVEYEAWIMDEDDPARGTTSTQLLDDGDATNDEDGNPLNDANRRLIVRAVGYAPDNTSVTLEAVIAPLPLPALVTGGDLAISGNATITGSAGSVHSNVDLEISGKKTNVSGDASASGALDCDDPCSQVLGTTSEGAAELPLPAIRASDYLSLADFILKSTGELTLPNGTVVCDATKKKACEDDYGWEFNKGWKISKDSAAVGTFYVEGTDVIKISGNPTVQISLIAEGSIELSGSVNLTPDTPELIFVTDGDLEISGNVNVKAASLQGGQLLVREQLKITGEPSINGQIIVEDAAQNFKEVTKTEISGNPTIIYNGTLGTGVFTVTGWHDVR